MSGSLVAKQSNSNYPGIALSGSLNISDSPNVASGSITGSGTIDGGTY